MADHNINEFKEGLDSWEGKVFDEDGNPIIKNTSWTYRSDWPVYEYTLVEAPKDYSWGEIDYVYSGGIIALKENWKLKKRYNPMEHPDLFLEFAKVDLFSPEEILKFYKRWGHLALSCFRPYGPDKVLVKDMGGGEYIWLGDWIFRIQDEILLLKHLLRLRAALETIKKEKSTRENSEEVEKAREYLKKHVNGNKVQIPTMSIDRPGEIRLSEYEVKEIRGDPTDIVAHIYIVRTISRYIQNYIVPVPIILEPIKQKELGLGYTFRLLISSLYFQFFNHMQKQKGLRICADCGVSFVPGQKRSWRCEKCRNKFKMKAYRQRENDKKAESLSKQKINFSIKGVYIS